ncbi:methyltransferase domain-containing protein [Congregibacter sp.]|uniref:methyltransferase domain-containing protein n=1 Tax=Congregibacter sp. TaxID=2744308 RepID=UPI003F6BF3F8
MNSESLSARILRRYKKVGAIGLFGSLKRLAAPQRASCAQRLRTLLKGHNSLEVGGPSSVFDRRGILPVYQSLKSVDNANFASETVWQKEIDPALRYRPDRNNQTGSVYLCDAVDMSVIGDAKYDVVLSSHVLEHLANPIKALNEWGRVLRDGGLLVLLTPRKEATFDHRRLTTSLEHLLRDYKQDVSEADLTHLDEILELHDIEMDAGVASFEEFERRSQDNVEHRCLHHHVFDLPLLAALFEHLNWEVLELESCEPAHSIVVARKPSNP